MGKRSVCARATRGASKGRRPPSSSSSNPKTTKFRSQYNSLAVIAKGGPSKKTQNKEARAKIAKEAIDRKKLLDGLQSINMLLEENEEGPSKTTKDKRRKRARDNDDSSIVTRGSQFTTASFASVWSNCTNASLNEFFQVWNPNLETHKDALAVIAGLSQTMTNQGTEQTDSEFAKNLYKIISAPDTPTHILTGSLLALTFVMRKLPADFINENFDSFYKSLKDLMNVHHTTNKKTLLKSLIRCFACITKAHPLGKEAIEGSLRKKVNIAVRRCKVQDKVRL